MEMYSIVGQNLNDLTFKVCQKALEKGSRIQSRNGMTYELINQEVILTQPKNRHLYLNGRSNNIYACIAEIFWVLAGEDKLDPLMNFFLKRAKDYSDDGLTWRAAYGARIYRHDAFKSSVEAFLKDGKYTRQSVLAIHHPDLDTNASIKDVYGLDSTKDKPCNNIVWFWIRNNQLHMKVGIRSNDVIFGMSAINIPEWTFLQEVMLGILKNENEEVFKDVTLGSYIHSPVSLHVYDETAKQAKDILDNNTLESLQGNVINYDIKLGKKILSHNVQQFFQDLYNSMCAAIVGDTERFDVDIIFSEWDIPKKENQLYSYAKLLEAYIQTKLNIQNSFDFTLLSEDLKQAVSTNKFTPAMWL